MIHSFPFDPAEILGVGPDATLHDIRLAYREKVKHHHPDAHGDAWAFRLVNQAYEILTRNRVAHQIAREEHRASTSASARDSASSRPQPDPGHAQPRTTTPPPSSDPDAEQVRTGVHDTVHDPTQLVDVDLLLLRFAVDDPMEFFTLPADQRNLSCSLNLNWPSRRSGAEVNAPANPAPYLAALKDAFTQFVQRTHPSGERSRQDGGTFMGWASFPTATAAAEAFQHLKRILNGHRLGVDQKTRELVLPREFLDA